jgi:5-oxoprolinase (ATP-hydrolysing) subunit A
VTVGIDLNADLGEGLGPWRGGDDAALLDLVSSANVACGFHAGDPTIMRDTCRAAAERGVGIGAHVGYPDLAGFGRREMGLTEGEVLDAVVVQIGSLVACAASVGARVSHVKLHGALYHRAAWRAETASTVVTAVRAVDRRLALLGPPGSALADECARRGTPMIAEGFADRGYEPDGRLAARSARRGLLHGSLAVEQALSLALHGRARAGDGAEVRVEVQSICLHGDSPDAVGTARAVRRALHDAGIEIRPFA